MSHFLKGFLCLGLALATFQPVLRAQVPSLGGGVGSTYNLGNSTFGAGAVQYTVIIDIQWGSNLMPSQYVSQSQLMSDFTGFVSSYPNASDPPEAILVSAAKAFAKKYSQFSLVSLSAAAGAATTIGSLSGFQAEITASAGNLQLPGSVSTGMTSFSDTMRRGFKAPR